MFLYVTVIMFLHVLRENRHSGRADEASTPTFLGLLKVIPLSNMQLLRVDTSWLPGRSSGGRVDSSAPSRPFAVRSRKMLFWLQVSNALNDVHQGVTS